MSNQALQQSIPRADTPVINPDGTMNMLWYRFFMSLMIKSGLLPTANVSNANRINVQSSTGRKISSTLYPGGPNASVAYYSAGGVHELNVYDVTTGQFIGRIAFSDWFGP